MPRSVVRTLLVPLVVCATLLGTAGVSGAEPPPAPDGARVRPELVDPRLWAELAGAPAGEQVEYLVALADSPDLAAVRFDHDAVVAALRRTAEHSQQPVVRYLEDAGGDVLNTFWLANLVLVRAANQTALDVTALPSVAAVLPVTELRVPEPATAPKPATVADRTWGVDRIGAHRVWDELGLTGSGVRVAVLDTGVRATHPDLIGQLVSDDPLDATYPGGWMEWDAAGNPVASQPHDTQNHGTHVSGTVAGTSAGGLHIGVAPGADLMHGLALPGGSGTTTQILAGMQWAVDPYDRDGEPAGAPAQVVNMSFGPETGGIIDQFGAAVRNMYLAGVLPVASAGNCGDGCHGSPGNAFEALAVGATDVDDAVADFSGGGPVDRADWLDPPADWPDSWLVPDLSAPGVGVISSAATGFGNYGTLSGTSMAAPHVAGTAALMLSGNPGSDPDEIMAALTGTAYFDDRYGQQRPNRRYGYGRIDAFQATARVVLDTGITGLVRDAGTGEAVEGVRVDVPEAGVSLRTGADGRFEFRLPPGTYTVALSWSGLPVATVPGVAVGDGMSSVEVPLSGVAGRVMDSGTGDPVTGAEVAVSGTGVGTVTGADGGYRLYLAPGGYDLAVAAFGYPDTDVPGVDVTEDGVTTVDVDLTALPTSTVTGTVTFVDSGLGVPGVTVSLKGGPRSATTGADGTYTLDEVPIGEHAVLARPELFQSPPAQPVTVRAGATSIVDFPLSCGGACAGQWVARHDGPQPTGYDSAAAVGVHPDGSLVYVTGGEGTFADMDYATVAYDPDTGVRRWIARYNGPGDGQDSAESLVVSPDGARVFVAGTSVGRPGGGSSATDYAVVAYAAATGDQLWAARYDGPAGDFDTANALAVSPDGTRVFVTGQSRATTAEGLVHTEYATLAYDAATGDELWLARYDGPSSNFDAARDLAVSPDGARVFVTGASPGAGGQSSGSGWDYATVAYGTATGTPQWVARYDGPGSGLDQAAAVAVDPNGTRVVVTGISSSDYATVAYHPESGDQLWATRYDGPAGGLDRARDLVVGPDGSAVYVTGASRSGVVADTADYATVAYAVAGGEELWAARYDGPDGGADEARAVAASPDGSQVVVTGTSSSDYATVAYDPEDGEQRWLAGYDGPAGDADDANAVAVSPDAAAVYVTGRSGLGLGDDPLVNPSDYATVAYDADGSGTSPVFVAYDLRAVPPVVATGEPVRVTAGVSNVGTGAGSYPATLVVAGATEATTTLTLEPGTSTEVGWTLTRAEPGSYPLRVGHATAQLRVVACDETVTGHRAGALAVTGGVTCLAAGARIDGPVSVYPGAGLLASGATVNGPVTSDAATVFALHATRVNGPVRVTGGAGTVSITASHVTGPVTLP